jgi:hypothetical protein
MNFKIFRVMNTHAEKITENKSQAAAGSLSGQSKSKTALKLEDNRSEAIAQRKVLEMANSHSRMSQLKTVNTIVHPSTSNTAQRKEVSGEGTLKQESGPVQKKENHTGLPDNLKTGIENLSGYSMDDVKVHYNSPRPAQLQAHAYAQGTDIHLASGKEKHLPHEAWHVVQQKAGRVKPTIQMKAGVQINDDKGLEKEADSMGGKALKTGAGNFSSSQKEPGISSMMVQRFTPLDSEIGTQVVVIDGPHKEETGIIKGISAERLNTFIVELRSKEQVEIPAENVDPLVRAVEEAFSGKLQLNNHFQLAEFMDEHFGDQWMFTGSIALKFWSEHYSKPLPRGLHDVDIIVAPGVYSNVPFVIKRALGDPRPRLADGSTTVVNNHGYVIDIFKGGGEMGSLDDRRIVPPGFKVMSLEALYEKKQAYQLSEIHFEQLADADPAFQDSEAYKAEKNRLDLEHIAHLQERPPARGKQS